MKQLIALLSLWWLVACVDQTSIQGDYISERDDCQDEAEDAIGDYSENDADVRVRNAKLVTLFSDCMFEHGWTVAAPEREEGGNPPELDAKRQAHDTSVGVGDTIKPGQDYGGATTAQPALPPAPATQVAPLPAAPAGYYYQLVPLPPGQSGATVP